MPRTGLAGVRLRAHRFDAHTPHQGTHLAASEFPPRLLPNLGVKPCQVHFLARLAAEHFGGALQECFLPLRDLIGVDIKAVGKLRACLSVSQRSKGYFGFEFWCQVTPLTPRCRRFFSSTSFETPWGRRALNTIRFAEFPLKSLLRFDEPLLSQEHCRWNCVSSI